MENIMHKGQAALKYSGEAVCRFAFCFAIKEGLRQDVGECASSKSTRLAAMQQGIDWDSKDQLD